MARRLRDRPKKPDPPSNPVLPASQVFSGLKTENIEPVREAIVEENQTQNQLNAAWKKYDNYSHSDVVALMKTIRYSSSDVERFSNALADFQNEKGFEMKAGLFLNALINCGKDSDYVIHTSHLAISPDFIGNENTKNIRVDGNAGVWLGRRMKSGAINVKGNAGREAGIDMAGGTITIDGNAGRMTGTGMVDGVIIINGDAGENTGQQMKGGSITINGNALRGGIGYLMERGAIILNGYAGRDVGRGMSGGSILVTGDVDITLGYGMKGGSIRLIGNATDSVGGVMEGGRLTVTGNTGDLLGERMKGGIIIVESNAGKDVGKGMEGGEIHIDGDIGQISQFIKHGKIYHKGILIVDK